MKIDLNCDMGESEDAAHEAALMAYITSANIACGGHAGDALTMERTARLALARGVRIGAHPGYPDRANFGRLEIAMTPEAIADTVYAQIARLDEVVRRLGGAIVHVKPHGALYNVAVRNAGGGARHRARRGALESPDHPLRARRVAHARRVARHGHGGGGRGVRRPALRTRWHAALAQIPRCPDYRSAEAAAQALRFARQGLAETICVHGDTPGSVAILKACRDAR